MAIGNTNIALRAQDFHEALKETVTFGPKEVHFKRTLLIGKTAILAMHLKGIQYVDKYENLEYAAAELGIGGIELPYILRELEEVDFADVIKSGDQFKRIDIRIPEFRDGYADLGERWKVLKPSEIEQAGVETLDALLKLPKKEEALQALGLDNTQLAILKDVMSAGQLIRWQAVSGENMLYSPLAVDANPIDYLKWTEKHSDNVTKLITSLTAHQGMPLGSEWIDGKDALEDAILTGVLMPIRVAGATGEQNFLFAPKGGLNPEERVIMDKARAILASVRYGQLFAAGRPIKYPRAILASLRADKQFRKGHPDLATQYSLLVEKMIGYPVLEANGRWNFRIYDSAENNKALDIAAEMLEIGESNTAHINIDAQKALLSPSHYQSPVSSRPRFASAMNGSTITQAEIVGKMADMLRGVV